MLPLTVLAIRVDDTPQMVHNLEIGGAHTYFAGDMAAWAHNRSGALSTARQFAERILRDGGRRPYYCRTNRLGQRIWMTPDTAGHGGSAIKYYLQQGRRLIWLFDADEFGDRICGKHKGPSGETINMNDLN